MLRRWRKKPALVEWDLTGDDAHGFGAVVFLTAAPVHVVTMIEPTLSSPEAVATAVDRWLGTVSDRYRLNTEFQEFKALSRRLSGEDLPVRRPGDWWRSLD